MADPFNLVLDQPTVVPAEPDQDMEEPQSETPKNKIEIESRQYSTPLGHAVPPRMNKIKVGIACILYEYNKTQW